MASPPTRSMPMIDRLSIEHGVVGKQRTNLIHLPGDEQLPQAGADGRREVLGTRVARIGWCRRAELVEAGERGVELVVGVDLGEGAALVGGTHVVLHPLHDVAIGAGPGHVEGDEDGAVVHVVLAGQQEHIGGELDVTLQHRDHTVGVDRGPAELPVIDLGESGPVGVEERCPVASVDRGEPVDQGLGRIGELAAFTGEVPRVELGERVGEGVFVEVDAVRQQFVVIQFADDEEHDLETAELDCDPAEDELRPSDRERLPPRADDAEVGGFLEARDHRVTAEQVHADDRPPVDRDRVVGKQRTDLIHLPGREPLPQAGPED